MSGPDAAQIVAALRDADLTAARLGIEILDADAGAVTIAMTVPEADTNALGMGHGGMVFTFADTAMQYASNSHGVDAVATSAAIDFLRPVRAGQRLTARAREAARTGKSAVCDVEVVDDDARLVAMFRGRTLRIGTPAPVAPEA